MDGPSGLATFMNHPEPPAFINCVKAGLSQSKVRHNSLSSSYMSACEGPQQLSIRDHLLVNSVLDLGKYSDEGVALDLCPAHKRA